jgi:hypothetical protein
MNLFVFGLADCHTLKEGVFRLRAIGMIDTTHFP